jgi:F420-non-reducing hydrogenase iron-sulfur subunit
MDNFEPRIIGFYCNWSSQMGVDSAGVEGASYPPNLRLIRVMCSGSVDPEVIIEAFKRGADGVLILGCHLGNCHYRNGNYNALRRYRLLQKMLDQFGLERERLRLEWVSVAEGKRFAGLVGEMTEELRRLGPLRQLS